MRNYVGTVDVMRARILEAGVGQASVYSNNTGNVVNTVPSQHIAVVVDDIDSVDDETIAEIIFETNGVGCPTHSYPVTGATAVVLTDDQGFLHTVNFTKATAVEVEIKMDIQFLDEENAGALEAIQAAVMDYVNGLPAGANVIYSHLYQYITPYGDAQVDVLFLQKDGDVDGVSNIVISTSEFARLTADNLLITEV
jgi:Ni,Fe-hydrogenase I large subunit